MPPLSGALQGYGAALRLLRTRRKVDQGELSTASGVSRSLISRYETEATIPGLDQFSRLLDGLDADLFDFQEALDEVAGRERRRRPAGPVDAATLTRLRLSYPHAPQELLVERAVVEQEMREALAKAERMQRELDGYERAAGPER